MHRQNKCVFSIMPSIIFNYLSFLEVESDLAEAGELGEDLDFGLIKVSI
jgi:hypothetical protein